MNLGENIYIIRSKRGMSQGALAQALEVSRQSVSKWENNSAVPELDKLIRMSTLFGITLDELVYGEKEATPPPQASYGFTIPVRLWIGTALLLFGMVFFLLSVFWGDHLKLGETFGELVSLCIVLISLMLVATDSVVVLSTCAVIYFLYTITSIGILKISSHASNFFVFAMGMVILFWFILLGLRLTKGTPEPKSAGDNRNDPFKK